MSEQAQARLLAGGTSALLAALVFALVAGLLTVARGIFDTQVPGAGVGTARLESNTGGAVVAGAAGRSITTTPRLDVSPSKPREEVNPRHTRPVTVAPEQPVAGPPQTDPGPPAPLPQLPETTVPEPPPAGAAIDMDAGPIHQHAAVSVGGSSGDSSQTTVQAGGTQVSVTTPAAPTTPSEPVQTVANAVACAIGC